MQLVIADTGPVNYLLLIGYIDILPALFEKVIVPSAVRAELSHEDAPSTVRQWIAEIPEWLEVREPGRMAGITGLGSGETAAIALAAEIRADLILMDDRRGVVAALELGINCTGTMGLLARAARQGFLSLPEAFERLKGTNFRYRREIMEALLKAAEADSGG